MIQMKKEEKEEIDREAEADQEVLVSGKLKMSRSGKEINLRMD